MDNQHVGKLGAISLTLLILSAVESVYILPPISLFGVSLFFFFPLSCLLFLFPLVLVCAQLTSAFPNQGGIFYWVNVVFGERVAVLAIWLQWLNTLIWFPTFLMFIASTIASIINFSYFQNKFFIVLYMIAIFWFLTVLCLKGIKISARVAIFCQIIGVIIPMALIIFLGLIWCLQSQPLQISLHTKNFLTSLTSLNNWSALTMIISSFVGLELLGVQINHVKAPHTTFPRALVSSSCFLLLMVLFSALAIAVVIPNHRINLTSGTIDAIALYFKAYHLHWLLPGIIILIIIGSCGNLINWIISPAKGLLQATQFGYLPTILQKVNRHVVPTNIILIQAVLVSILSICFLFIISVNNFYWLLTVISMQLYLTMYCILYMATWYLTCKKFYRLSKQIIFSKFKLRLCCAVGLFGCLLVMGTSFILPETIHINHFLSAEIIFILTTFAIVLILSIISRKCSAGYRGEH